MYSEGYLKVSKNVYVPKMDPEEFIKGKRSNII